MHRRGCAAALNIFFQLFYALHKFFYQVDFLAIAEGEETHFQAESRLRRATQTLFQSVQLLDHLCQLIAFKVLRELTDGFDITS